jgi:flagella basal body P-ring formation protein FlgA
MSTPVKTILLLCCALLLSGVCRANPGSGLEVRILEEAAVTGDTITLADVSEFSGRSDASLPELKRIVLAHAPPPGRTLVLDRAFLEYRLGKPLRHADVSVHLPNRVAVERLARKIRKEDLKRIFVQYVREHMPWPPDAVDFRDIRAPEVLHLPRGRLSHRVRPLGREDYLGNVAILATFAVDGVRQRTVRICGQVDVRRKVVVASKNLPRNQEVRADAVRLTEVNLARVPADVLTRVSEAIGMETVQSIRAGQVVVPRMLKRAPAFERGDCLALVAESASVRVVTSARALEEGYRGEQVRVTNISSGKEVRARVVGARKVAVDF